MSATASTLGRKPKPLIAAAAIVGMLTAGTLGLWAYYGTTVFFEMVRTGWAACF